MDVPLASQIYLRRFFFQIIDLFTQLKRWFAAAIAAASFFGQMFIQPFHFIPKKDRANSAIL